MSCELFDHLKSINFADEPKCIYEGRCIFAGSQNINSLEASESCQALKDTKDDDSTTIEDIQQEMCLKSLVCASRLN